MTAVQPPAQPSSFDPAFCEREYNARAAVPEAATLLGASTERARAARAMLDAQDGGRQARQELAFGPGAKERIDFFPAGVDGAPLLVFIHGGYWRALDKEDVSWIAPPWLSRGVSVALPNYDLLPTVPMETIVAQVRAALAFLWRDAPRLGVDRDRIVVCGHSAGGHLAAIAACTDWPAHGPDLPSRIARGTLSISGLHDLEPLRHAPFLSRDLALDTDRARALSPAYQTPNAGLRAVTCVGGDESSEFHRQARLLAQHWGTALEHDVPMPGRNHFTVVEALAEPGSALFEAAADLLER